MGEEKNLTAANAISNYEKVYEEAFFIEVKPDKIYEITAVWKDEKLEERGFSGEASYVLKTE